jgi:hypothetical protein
MSLEDGKAIPSAMLPPFKKESYFSEASLTMTNIANTCTRIANRQPLNADLRTEYLVRHPVDEVCVAPTVSRSLVEERLKVWFTRRIYKGKTSGTQVFTFKQCAWLPEKAIKCTPMVQQCMNEANVYRSLPVSPMFPLYYNYTTICNRSFLEMEYLPLNLSELL